MSQRFARSDKERINIKWGRKVKKLLFEYLIEDLIFNAIAENTFDNVLPIRVLEMSLSLVGWGI